MESHVEEDVDENEDDDRHIAIRSRSKCLEHSEQTRSGRRRPYCSSSNAALLPRTFSIQTDSNFTTNSLAIVDYQ